MRHYWIFAMALIVASIVFLAMPAAAQFTDVATITAARAQADGTDVNITGKVKVIGRDKLDYSDFAIQDSSGSDGQTGIFVYYGSNVQGISDGDTISGVKGRMSTYYEMRELTVYYATAYTPTIYTGGDVLPDPAPLELTGTEFTTNYANYGGELIKLTGSFDSPSGNFVGSPATNYAFTTNDAQAVAIRVYYNCELVGDPVPSGTQTVTGIAAIYQTTYEIFPRFDTDVQPWAPPTPTPGPSTGVSVHWELYQ
jgi:hypothetical protein